jgi:hypothetical protein
MELTGQFHGTLASWTGGVKRTAAGLALVKSFSTASRLFS